MFEIAHDPLDRVFHAVEAFKGPIGFDGAIEEDAAQPRVLRGVHQFRLADGRHHAFGGRSVEHLVVARGQKPVTQAHRLETFACIVAGENVKDIKRAHQSHSLLPRNRFLSRDHDPLTDSNPIIVAFFCSSSSETWNLAQKFHPCCSLQCVSLRTYACSSRRALCAANCLFANAIDRCASRRPLLRHKARSTNRSLTPFGHIPKLRIGNIHRLFRQHCGVAWIFARALRRKTGITDVIASPCAHFAQHRYRQQPACDGSDRPAGCHPPSCHSRCALACGIPRKCVTAVDSVNHNAS